VSYSPNESSYDLLHNLHTNCIRSQLSFKHQLQPLVNTFQEKSVENLISNHLVVEIVPRIVRLFVRKIARVDSPLRAVSTRVFCVRFSVCNDATAQLLPLLDHVRDRARKAKEAVGRRRHRGQRNGRKKREFRRPFKAHFPAFSLVRT
jgi:hypothetical protein